MLEVSDLLACLRAKLPPDEVNTALELALQEAGATSLAGGGVEAANGIDFEAFMSLLKVGTPSRVLRVVRQRLHFRYCKLP